MLATLRAPAARLPAASETEKPACTAFGGTPVASAMTPEGGGYNREAASTARVQLDWRNSNAEGHWHFY